MAGSNTTTVRDLRRSNRSRALWQVFLGGPMTRQEIGVLAGLSPATVSNLVADLVSEGIIAEVQKTVMKLNALNEKSHGGLIETDQREMICEIINLAAAYAGYDAGTRDLTEEWREW